MKKVIKIFLLFFVVVIPLGLIACGGDPQTPELVSIEFYKYPNKQAGYNAFDIFDDSGMQLKASYSDGSFVILDEGWTISYISEIGGVETKHNDCFYGGDTRIKIKYENKSIGLQLIDEVRQINRDVYIEIEEFSQVKTDNIMELPSENVKITDSQGNVLTSEYELIYCKEFESYLNYNKTTSDDGAANDGNLPTKIGTYKVFAKVNADNNYNEVVSNVVEFSIIDSQTIDLYAKEDEEFFGFKEVSQLAQQNMAYIEFEVSQDDQILYYSTFAGDGKAMIFSDHITLVGSDEKTQIIYENNKILINNSTKTLEKWTVPNYIGTYEMIVTPDMADDVGMEFSKNETCFLKIFYDEDSRDGNIKFEFNGIWFIVQGNSDQWHHFEYEGFVDYSPSSKKLTFNLTDGSNLFSANNVNISERLESILVNIPGSEIQLSNGEYVRV